METFYLKTPDGKYFHENLVEGEKTRKTHRDVVYFMRKDHADTLLAKYPELTLGELCPARKKRGKFVIYRTSTDYFGADHYSYYTTVGEYGIGISAEADIYSAIDLKELREYVKSKFRKGTRIGVVE